MENANITQTDMVTDLFLFFGEIQVSKAVEG